MKIVTLILFCIFQSAIAQELYASAIPNNYTNLTIMEALETLSPTLYTHIHKDPQFIQIFDQIDYNITFLLPNETTLNSGVNYSEPIFDSLSFLMLNGSFTKKSFLSRGRQFYTTLEQNQPNISIGPLLVNFVPSNEKLEIFSGLTKAQISATEITCRNGIIQFIDNLLKPAQSPLTTISIMDETEYMEGLLKSLNVSNIISGENKTILAPISDAWKRAKGNSIPFGTLVLTLKYLVLDGVYTTNDIVTQLENSTTSIRSDYNSALVNFTLNAEKKLVLNGKSMIVNSDILTTTGIIHLIDDVFTPTGENIKDPDDGGISSNNNNGDSPKKTSISPYSSNSNHVTITVYHFCFIIVLIYLSL